MARRKAKRVAVVTLLLTASATFAACAPSAADKAGPTATVATEPPRTTTSTTNPYAIPAVIDIAYVNRVLAGLDAVMGDVTRLVVRTKTIPREAYDRLRAVYVDDERLQRVIDGLQRDLRNGLSGYKPGIGNKTSTVTQLISTRSTCVFVRVARDYSNVGVNPLPALDVQWIALRPLDPARDTSSYNLTRWTFAYEGFPPDHSQPSDPCAS